MADAPKGRGQEAEKEHRAYFEDWLKIATDQAIKIDKDLERGWPRGQSLYLFPVSGRIQARAMSRLPQ